MQGAEDVLHLTHIAPHCLAASLQAASAGDPAHNPVLLPPRTRADVVQDRPAGGSPDEVAAANPSLAAAIPATVGQDPAAIEERTGDAAAASGSDAAGALTAHSAAETGGGPGPEGPEGQAAAGQAGKGADEVRVASLAEMGDGSGMEMPELAVQEGWTH